MDLSRLNFGTAERSWTLRPAASDLKKTLAGVLASTEKFISNFSLSRTPASIAKGDTRQELGTRRVHVN